MSENGPNEEDNQELEQAVMTATRLLEQLHQAPRLLGVLPQETRRDLLRAAGRLSKPDGKAKREINREVRKRNKAAHRKREEARLDKTGIRVARSKDVFETPRLRAPEGLGHPGEDSVLEEALEVDERHCYVCKESYTQLHHFYDQLCPSCGDFNAGKRQQQADLTGRVALITGARVKIGYQAAMLLLRSGARVICTTRFPNDAAARYAKEDDFDNWKDRLEIFGLDLRHTPSVETFCQFLVGHLERLDFIINNACQTVRRPPAFYGHLQAAESDTHGLSAAQLALLKPYQALCQEQSSLLLGDGEHGTAHQLVGASGLTHAPDLASLALLPEDVPDDVAKLFPSGQLDADLQQVDLREKNSWRLRMHEVSAVELLEVNLVNAVAPFLHYILCNGTKLKK